MENNTEAFVKAVIDEKNVEASKILEQVMKEKTAKRLRDVLKS